MANSNKPFGFRAVGSNVGAQLNMAVRKYLVPATDGTAIYIGDPVKEAGSAGALYPDDSQYPTAAKAASGDVVCGVCVGIQPLYNDLTTNYRKASTAMYILVNTDPGTVYEAQGDSTVFAATDIGLNANFTASTGSATTGVSNATVGSGKNTTATLDVKLLGFVPAADNEVGAYCRFLVMLNNHRFANQVAGV